MLSHSSALALLSVPILLTTVMRVLPLIEWQRKRKKENIEKRLYRVRMYEDVTLLLIYLVNVAVEFYFFGCAEMWRWARDEGLASVVDSPITSEAVYFLRYQLALYTSLAFLVLLPPRKRDHQVMLTHHLTTFSLILSAYTYGFWHVAVVVLLLHDLCDIFLQISVITHRSRPECNESVAAFSVFATLHLLLRVGVFPVITTMSVYHSDSLSGLDRYLPLSLCLPVWLLHVYWSGKIWDVIRTKFVECKPVVDERDLQQQQQQHTHKKKITTKQ